MVAMYRRIIVAMLAVLILCTPLIVKAQSQDANITSKSALVVSPAILEHVLTPGEPVPFTVQVQNVIDFPLPIKGFVRGLAVEEHTDLSKDERARLDASQWFTIENPDFILQPKQVRTVTGTIQPPANADPGGHYATVFFQPLVPAEALSPTMVYVNARVGVLSFLIVKGDIDQKAQLKTGLKTAGLAQGGPIEFTFSIHNSGNVHLLPSGKVAIYNMFNTRVANLDIPRGIVLPNSSREYTIKWDGPGASGKYRAELTAEYGPENLKLTKTTTIFWIVPWVKILLGSVLLAAAVLLARRIRRRGRRAWRAFHE